MRRLALSAAVALLPLLAAAAPDDAISIDRAWARATPGAATVGAAYLRIRSAADDRLIGIASPAAARTELHDHVEQDGMMRMQRIDAGLPLKAGQPLELRSGGLHLMLLDLKAPLRAGDSIPVTLTFEKAGIREATLHVEPLGARGPSEPPAGQAAGGRQVALATPGPGSAHRRPAE